MPVYTAELADGRKVQAEFEHEPTEQDFLDLIGKQSQEQPETSAAGTFARSAAAGVAPGAAFMAGFGATALPVTEAFAGSGFLAPIIGGAAGMVVGGTLAGAAAYGQGKLLKAYLPNFYRKLTQGEEEHPYASIGGELASGAGPFKLASIPTKALAQELGTTVPKLMAKQAIGRAAIGAGMGAVQPIIFDRRGPNLKDIGVGAGFGALYAEPRFKVPALRIPRFGKGVPDASSQQEAAKVHGNVQPQPVQGAGQVPTQGSGEGIRAQAQEVAKGTQVPLKADVAQESDGSWTVKAGDKVILSTQDENHARGTAALWEAEAQQALADKAKREPRPMEEEVDPEEAKRYAESERTEPAVDPVKEGEDLAEQAAKQHGQELVSSSGVPDENIPFVRGFFAALGGNKVYFNRQEFRAWLESMPREQWGRAIRSAMQQERIHNLVRNTVGDAGAAAYWNAMSAIEKWVNVQRYLGNRAHLAGAYSPSQLGHEAIRFRMERAANLTPLEFIDSNLLERPALKLITSLEDVVRGVRETLGTRASNKQLDILDRINGNLIAAKAVNLGIAPPEAGKRKVPYTLEELRKHIDEAEKGVKFASTYGTHPDNIKDAKEALIDAWDAAIKAYLEQRSGPYAGQRKQQQKFEDLQKVVPSLAGSRLDSDGSVLTTDSHTIAGPGIFAIRRVYHGTPHEIQGQLDPNKIGTGQGANSYGWGFYWAENKEVGKNYYQQLATRDGFIVNGRKVKVPTLDDTPDANTEYDAIKFVADMGWPDASAMIDENIHEKIGDLHVSSPSEKDPSYRVGKISEPASSGMSFKTLKEARNFYEQVKLGMQPFDAEHEEMMRIQRHIKDLRGAEIKPLTKGGLYTANLDLADHEVLDWDAEVSDQKHLPPHLHDLNSQIQANRKFGDPSFTGQQLYNYLSSEYGRRFPVGKGPPEAHGWDIHNDVVPSPRAASEALSKQGIKAIRYLDQGSRFKEEVKIGDRSFKANPDGSTSELAAAAWLRGGKTLDGAKSFLEDYLVDNQISNPDTRSRVERAKEILEDFEFSEIPRTYNYVVFDPDRIKITHKNGTPTTLHQAAGQGELPFAGSRRSRLESKWEPELGGDIDVYKGIASGISKHIEKADWEKVKAALASFRSRMFNNHTKVYDDTAAAALEMLAQDDLKKWNQLNPQEQAVLNEYYNKMEGTGYGRKDILKDQIRAAKETARDSGSEQSGFWASHAKELQDILDYWTANHPGSSDEMSFPAAGARRTKMSDLRVGREHEVLKRKIALAKMPDGPEKDKVRQELAEWERLLAQARAGAIGQPAPGPAARMEQQTGPEHPLIAGMVRSNVEAVQPKAKEMIEGLVKSEMTKSVKKSKQEKGELERKVTVPTFDDLVQWAERNAEGVTKGRLAEIWLDEVGKHLVSASPERLSDFLDAFNLHKPKAMKAAAGEMPTPQTELQRELASREKRKIAPADEGTFRLEPEYDSLALANRQRKAMVRSRQYREKVMSDIYHKFIEQTRREVNLDRDSIDETAFDYSNARLKHGAYRTISDADSNNVDILTSLLSADARESGTTTLSHTRRVVALKDRAGESVSLVSAYPEGGIVRIVDPASAGQKKPHVELNASFLKRFKPIATGVLQDPVRNFHQRFENEAEYLDKIGSEAERIDTVEEKDNLVREVAKIEGGDEYLENERQRSVWQKREVESEGAEPKPKEEGEEEEAKEEEYDPEHAPFGTDPEFAEKAETPGPSTATREGLFKTQVERAQGGVAVGEHAMEARLLMDLAQGTLFSKEPLTASEAMAIYDVVTDHNVGMPKSRAQMHDLVDQMIQRVREAKAGSGKLYAKDIKAIVGIKKAAERLFNSRIARVRRIMDLKGQRGEIPPQIQNQMAREAYADALQHFYEIITSKAGIPITGKPSQDATAWLTSKSIYLARALKRYGERTQPDKPTPTQQAERYLMEQAKPKSQARDITMPINRVPPTVMRPEQLPPDYVPHQRAGVPTEGPKAEFEMPELGLLGPKVEDEGPPPTSEEYLPAEAQEHVAKMAAERFPYDPSKAYPQAEAFQYPSGKGKAIYAGSPEFIIQSKGISGPRTSRHTEAQTYHEIKPKERGLRPPKDVEQQSLKDFGLAPEAGSRRVKDLWQHAQENNERIQAFLGAQMSRKEIKEEVIFTGADISSNIAATLGEASRMKVVMASLADVAKRAEGIFKWKKRAAAEAEALKFRGAAMAVIGTGEIFERQVPRRYKPTAWGPEELKQKIEERFRNDLRVKQAELERRYSLNPDLKRRKIDEEKLYAAIEKSMTKRNEAFGQPQDKPTTKTFWAPNIGTLDKLEEMLLKGVMRDAPDGTQQRYGGLPAAQQLANSPNITNQRVGKMWMKEIERRLAEIRFAREHWGDTRLRETVSTIRTELRNQWKYENENGLNVRQFMNYLPDRFEAELWSDNSILFPKWEVLGRNFRQARKFPSAYHAAAEGPYILKSSDPADLVSHRVRQGANAVNRADMYKALLAKNDPDTGEPIAYRVQGQGNNQQVVLRDGSLAPKSPEYTVLTFDGGRTQLAVRKGYSAAVGAAYGESILRETPITRDMLRFGQWLKHNGILIYDTFHPGRLTQYGWSLLGSNANHMKGWSALEFRKQDLMPPELVPGIKGVLQGPSERPLAVRKGLISQEHADWALTPVEVNAGGQKIQTTYWDIAQAGVKMAGLNVGQLQDALYNQVSHLLPGLKGLNNIVFNRLTRGLMMQAFVEKFVTYHKQFPNTPMYKIMRDVAKDLNYRFGAIGRQGVIKQPWIHDATMLVMLAPRWVEGLAQSEIRTYSRLIRSAARPLGLTKLAGREGLPAYGALGSSMMKGMLAWVGITQALNAINWAMGWKSGWDKGENPMDAYLHTSHDPKGDIKISPMSVFAELSHDILRLSETKPRVWDALDQVGRNKLGPWGRVGVVLTRGTNERGEKISSTANVAKEAVSELAPYPITFQRPGQWLLSKVGLAAPPQPGSVMRQALASGFGVKGQAAESAYVRMRRMADQFVRKNGLRTDPLEVQPTDEPSYGKLRSAIRAGDNRAAKRIMNKLLETHTMGEVYHAMRVWSQRPFTGKKANEQLFLSQMNGAQLNLYTEAQQERTKDLTDFILWYTSN